MRPTAPRSSAVITATTPGSAPAAPARMVAAEQDAVVADGPREIAERLRPLDERVVMEAPEVAAGKSSAVRARLGPGPMGAVEAADVIGQEPAAVHEHHRKRRKPVERAAENEAGRRQGRLERIADQVVQVVAAEPLDRLEEIGMEH